MTRGCPAPGQGVSKIPANGNSDPSKLALTLWVEAGMGNYEQPDIAIFAVRLRVRRGSCYMAGNLWLEYEQAHIHVTFFPDAKMRAV